MKKPTHKKKCKQVGVRTTDGSRWCNTHDKWEADKLAIEESFQGESFADWYNGKD